MASPGDEVRANAQALAAQPDRSLLSLIGEGLVSFGAGKPVTQLRNEASIALINQNQAALGQQDLEAEQRAIQRQQRQQELANEAFSGGPGSEQAAARFAVEFPEEFEAISEAAGIRTQAQKTEAADFAVRLRNTPFDQRQVIIDRRVTELSAVGRDPQHTASLTGLSEQDQNNAAMIFELQALTPKERSDRARGIGLPAEERAFESLIAEFTPDEQAMARRVKAGLETRAGTQAAVERIATDPTLTEQVAESKAVIKEREKFAERTASSRATIIDKGFASIGNINKNIRNMERAIAALEGGASTGAIESRFFPSIRESSVILDNIQGQLALDVIGSVTFGALSKGELDLAREIALPTNLQPPELIKFLQEKKVAQEKLRTYYEAQITHLDGGGSIASFLKEQRDQDDRTTSIEGFIVEEVR